LAFPKNERRKIKGLPQKILNLRHTGRRRIEGDQNKMERRRTQSDGRMWFARWRLGGQTPLEIWCQNTLPYAIERLHTYKLVTIRSWDKNELFTVL
jgi:hypothetical protein